MSEAKKEAKELAEDQVEQVSGGKLRGPGKKKEDKNQGRHGSSTKLAEWAFNDDPKRITKL